MLKNKQIVWHVKRKTMRNIYIDNRELSDLIDSCKPAEIKLFSHILNLTLCNPSIDALSTEGLAKGTNMSEGTIKNSRAALVKRGLLIIKKFKDESGDSMVRVVVGKEQVELYNLGLKVEISDSKAYRNLLEQFPITDKNLKPDVRKDMVERANQYYLDTQGK